MATAGEASTTPDSPMWSIALASTTPVPVPESEPVQAELFRGQRDFVENQRGISCETVLMPYLQGATEIELHDPYMRLGH